MRISEKGVPARGNRKTTGLESGMSLVCLKNKQTKKAFLGRTQFKQESQIKWKRESKTRSWRSFVAKVRDLGLRSSTTCIRNTSRGMDLLVHIYKLGVQAWKKPDKFSGYYSYTVR